jgi:hypothetical protein
MLLSLTLHQFGLIFTVLPTAAWITRSHAKLNYLWIDRWAYMRMNRTTDLLMGVQINKRTDRRMDRLNCHVRRTSGWKAVTFRHNTRIIKRFSSANEQLLVTVLTATRSWTPPFCFATTPSPPTTCFLSGLQVDTTSTRSPWWQLQYLPKRCVNSIIRRDSFLTTDVAYPTILFLCVGHYLIRYIEMYAACEQKMCLYDIIAKKAREMH